MVSGKAHTITLLVGGETYLETRFCVLARVVNHSTLVACWSPHRRWAGRSDRDREDDEVRGHHQQPQRSKDKDRERERDGKDGKRDSKEKATSSRRDDKDGKDNREKDKEKERERSRRERDDRDKERGVCVRFVRWLVRWRSCRPIGSWNCCSRLYH